MHLGLGELKSTSIILQLTDRSMKIPRGIIEDVLIKIDKFYYLVDFIVIDTQRVQDPKKHTPVILSHHLLATTDIYISCGTGNVQLSFGNMTMELNIFNVPKQTQDDDEVIEVDMIEASVDDSFISNHCDNPLTPCTTDFDFSVDVDSGIEEVNSTFIIDLVKWKEKIEPLPPEEKIEPFKLELLLKEV